MTWNFIKQDTAATYIIYSTRTVTYTTYYNSTVDNIFF